jgi:hypothetical protein
MAITCLCPSCQKTLAISEEFAGQPMRCPLCHAVFQSPPAQPVPVTDGRPAAVPPAEESPPWLAAPPWLPAPEPAAPRPTAPEAVTPPTPELANLRNGDSRRLPQGWHMVRYGLAIIPPGLVVATFVLLGSRAFLYLYAPELKTYQMVMLVTVPVTVLATLVALVGGGLCCLVPPETGLRRLAQAAAACLLAGQLVALLTLGFRVLFSGPAGKAAALATSAYIPADLLAFAGGLVFLFFLRGVARYFKNQRVSQSVFVCILVVGGSPLLFFFIYLLLTVTNALVGGDGTGRDILAGLVLYGISGVDLFWFLHVLSDVRRTVERGYLGAMA